MAGTFELLYSQNFTSSNSIVVTHNQNIEFFKIKVIINGESREDLITSINPTPSDPTNEITIKLSGVYSGTIQVFLTDFTIANDSPISKKLIATQEDDATVVSNTRTFNFEGDVTVVDEGAEKATVIIAPNLTGLLTEIPTVQVTRTTDFVTTTTFSNLTFDRTDIENNATVIEHDNVNTERVNVKETGLYFISYGLAWDYTSLGTFSSQVLINDTTFIPGSLMAAIDGNDQDEASKAFAINLTANDYITLQVKKSGGAADVDGTDAETTLIIYKMTGIKGEQGDPGSGSTIVIQDEDITVTGGPHDTINFEGASVSVANDGAGKATVTVTGSLFGSYFQKAESLGVSTTNSTTFVNKVTLVTSSVPDGTYRVGFCYGWNHDNTGNDFEARFQEDGVDMGEIHKQEPKDSSGSFSTTGTLQRQIANRCFYTTLTAGSYTYTLDFRTDDDDDESSIWDAVIEFWRVS